MTKLVKRVFANTLAATVLMYLKDTLLVSKDHQLHFAMAKAASPIFLSNDHDTIISCLCKWGERIRTRFIMDNLTQLKTSDILANLSHGDVSDLFVGANTFGDILQKLVGGYRGLMSEVLELRGIVLDQANAFTRFHDTAETHTQMLQQILAKLNLPSASNLNLRVNSSDPCLVVPNQLQLQQPRSWPIKTLEGKTLSTLIYEFACENLISIPTNPG